MKRHYELWGFTPIDTPIVERPEVLSAKAGGEINKQVYGLRLLNPPDGSIDDSKDLGIRFDLTVPLARHVAANQNKINFPFRRSQFGYVMRGERSKKGRYRNFIQYDIDTIGDGVLSFQNDAECVAAVIGIFCELAFGRFRVHINNRKILMGWFETYEITSDADQRQAINYIDELEKVGRQEVIHNLSELGLNEEKAMELLTILTDDLPVDEMIAKLEHNPGNNQKLLDGISELKKVVNSLRMMGAPEEHFCVNLSIARGLDYYTSTVFETFLEAHKGVGSIASGGRYEDLAGYYTNKKLPGVGVSIGITRLVMKLIDAGIVDAKVNTIAPILITTQNLDKNQVFYLKIARMLRDAGIGVETYFPDAKLAKQMKFANKRGFRIALIANDEECELGFAQVRDLKSGDQEKVELGDIVNHVRYILNPPPLNFKEIKHAMEYL